MREALPPQNSVATANRPSRAHRGDFDHLAGVRDGLQKPPWLLRPNAKTSHCGTLLLKLLNGLTNFAQSIELFRRHSPGVLSAAALYGHFERLRSVHSYAMNTSQPPKLPRKLARHHLKP